MLFVDGKTLLALEAVCAHRHAWFTANDLLLFLSQNPQIEPMEYAAMVKLQLDVVGAIKDYLAAREVCGKKNVMEGLGVSCATMGLALAKVTESHPMPDADLASHLAGICSQAFDQNVSVRWKVPQWNVQPTHELPHSTN